MSQGLVNLFKKKKNKEKKGYIPGRTHFWQFFPEKKPFLNCMNETKITAQCFFVGFETHILVL